MKKVLTVTTAALMALSVFADDTKKTNTSAPAAATGTVLDAPPVVASTDSPLVAAAKRANRKGKKPANVITNETVKKPSKAHVTTSTIQSTLPPLPPQSSEAQLLAQRAEQQRAADKARADAEKKLKDQEAADRRLAIAASAAESGLDDPALAEHHASEAQKAAKDSEKKPPQP